MYTYLFVKSKSIYIYIYKCSCVANLDAGIHLSLKCGICLTNEHTSVGLVGLVTHHVVDLVGLVAFKALLNLPSSDRPFASGRFVPVFRLRREPVRAGSRVGRLERSGRVGSGFD